VHETLGLRRAVVAVSVPRCVGQSYRHAQQLCRLFVGRSRRRKRKRRVVSPGRGPTN